MFVENEISVMKPLLTRMRRELHRIPESGFEEFRTVEYIRSKLKEFGIEKTDIWMETGTVAVIEGAKPGITVGYRADIDGLPVDEPDNKDFVSENKGMMHACGHDGHTACLLGFAKYICDNRDKLRGKVVLIFQPAEEGPGGAERLIEAGLTERYGIERYVGLHIFPEFEQGKIACRVGPMMARNGEFTVKIKGVGAHGAQPQKGRDAVLAASAVIVAINTVISRNISPLDSAVVSIGQIHGGTARNVVAQYAEARGTMRAFSDEVYHGLVERINEVAEYTAKAYGCVGEVEYNHMYRVVNNNEEMVSLLRSAVGKDSYVESDPYMIAEDFSFYQTEADGVFFFLGSKNSEKGFIAPLHSCDFDFDEEILLYGIQTFVGLLKELKCF